MDVPINRCYVCGISIEQPTRGRRLYCSNACRQKAKRARGARVLTPADRLPDADPVEAFLVGRTAPLDDQVLSAVHESILLVVTFRRLGAESRRQFAWRCLGMADAIEQALVRFFKESAS